MIDSSWLEWTLMAVVVIVAVFSAMAVFLRSVINGLENDGD